MISLNDICYKYPGKEGFALENISFTAKPGEIFTLLGPNGSGKTTIIRILSGLIIPSSGEIRIADKEVLQDDYRARGSLGLVLGDERTFYYRLSGAQNLEFFGGLYGIGRNKLKKRIKEVMEIVGLQADSGLQYMRYSTGMKKRLSMARALMHDPQVLLLDEPNSGVDPHSARKIRELIISLKSLNRTILLTTHDMEEAEKLSDIIGFLRSGKLIKVGKVSDYKNMVAKNSLEVEFDMTLDENGRPLIRELINELKQNLVCDSIQFRNNILLIQYNGSFNMDMALSIISRRGFNIQKAKTAEASLEDVFIKLAG